jgi:hypothetical protein
VQSNTISIPREHSLKEVIRQELIRQEVNHLRIKEELLSTRNRTGLQQKKGGGEWEK